MKAGDYARGCPLVAESFRREPLPGALFTWAECETRAEHAVVAHRLFGDFLERVGHLPAAERTSQEQRVRVAEERRRELEPKVPFLEILLPTGAPDGLEIFLDGEKIERRAIGVPLGVEPGTHELLTKDGRGSARLEVLATAGRVRQVVAPVPAPPAEKGPAPLVVEPPRPAVRVDVSSPAPLASDVGATQRTWGWISLGAGAAGFITAGIATGVLLDKKPELTANCPSGVCQTDAAFETASSVPAWNAVGTTGVIVGALGVGLGAVLLLTAPDDTGTATVVRTRVGAFSGLELEHVF